MADLLPIALRAAAYVAVMLAAGLALYRAYAGVTGGAGWLRVCAVIALLSTLAYQLLEPARLTGDLRGVFDAELQALLLQSSAGCATALRAGGALLLWWRPQGLPALLACALMMLSFAVTGHATEIAWSLPAQALLALHLGVGGFWLGALACLLPSAVNRSDAALVTELRQFTAVAGWLVPCMALAGLVMAVLLAPGWSVLTQDWGRLLLAKIGGFSLLMALAALNRWRLTPAIAAGNREARRTLRHSLTAELALVIAIIATTAVMTALSSPRV